MAVKTKAVGRDRYMQIEGTKMWKKVYGPNEQKPFEEALKEWHTSYFGEWLPDSSSKTEKKKKPRLIAFVNDKCTGCLDCVEFCPVDCIDISPRSLYDDDYSPTKTIMIRYDECIGC
ncbi:MAG: ferredoxin family protein, partial [Nitrospinota bacterium]